MSVLTYSPKDVTVILGGVYNVSGFANNTFVNIRKHVNPYEIHRSADGEIARSHRNDNSYSIDLTLAQSSSANDVLNILYNLDQATQMGMFPLFIKDSSGNTTFLSTSTWIITPPDISFNSNLTERTWTLHSSQGFLSIGGNSDKSLIEDLVNQISTGAPLLSKLGLI